VGSKESSKKGGYLVFDSKTGAYGVFLGIELRILSPEMTLLVDNFHKAVDGSVLKAFEQEKWELVDAPAKEVATKF
jgi:hypothetical protein